MRVHPEDKLAMTREKASLFFRLVSYRYDCGAMIITTNRSIRDWTELLALGRRRGAGHRDPGPTAAPRPRPEHQGAQLPRLEDALKT
jgi:hypothetical protein